MTNNTTTDSQNLIWIDLEMTGLDPTTDTIIEIATVVTNKDLTVLANGPSLAIHQSDEVLNSMNEWCIKQHSKSGLTKRVQQSTISMQEAQQQTLDFLKQWTKKGTSPMCGNSICQDRRFLANYMPKLEAFFHYRHIDVSTLKELAKRWKPNVEKDLEKNSSHLALDDIYDSIDELKHYRKCFIQE
jgi:oligoribonuclease